MESFWTLKNFGNLLIGCFFLACMSCQSNSNQSPVVMPVDRAVVADQYRLQADREAFDKIRSEVPQETKTKNDELAFTLGLFDKADLPPDRIREKFNFELSKKKEKFNKDIQKKREDFVRQERKSREAFTQDHSKKRQEFSGTKHSSQERHDFYEELEQKRKDFYEGQKESRDAFEADIRDDRKNFEDYSKEKLSDFQFRFKQYEQKWRESHK